MKSKESLFVTGVIGWEIAHIGAATTAGLERAQGAVNLGAAFRDLIEVLVDLPPEAKQVVAEELGKKIAKGETQPLFVNWNSFPKPGPEVIDFLGEIQKALKQ